MAATVEWSYGSLGEMVSAALVRADHKYGASQKEKGSLSWDNGVGFDGALELARNGWAEGADRINDKLAPMVRHVTARLVVHRPDFGARRPGTLHMGRYIADSPRPYLTSREVEGTGHKVTRVIVNLSTGGIVPADMIERRGYAVASLVDLLEHTGHPVELTVVDTCKNKYATDASAPQVEGYCVIKKAGDAMNLETIAFTLAHPAMLRRLAFACWEGCKPETRKFYGLGTGIYGGGYGQPVEAKIDRGDLYLPMLGYNTAAFRTDSNSEQWLLDTLKSQGVEILEDQK